MKMGVVCASLCCLLMAGAVTSAHCVPITTYGTSKVIYVNNAKSNIIFSCLGELDFNTSVTIPADWIDTGKLIRVRVGGYWINEHYAEATTIYLKAKLGNYTLVNVPAIVTPSVESDGTFWLEFDAVCVANGANKDIEANGLVAFGEQAWFSPRNDVTYPVSNTISSIDTTQAHNLKITANVANSGYNAIAQIKTICVEVIE